MTEPPSSWWYSDADKYGRYTTARADFHVEQMISVVVKRPWRRLGRRGYLLFGGSWLYYTDRWGVAFRQDDAGDSGRHFDPGFECSKDPVDVRHHGPAPVYGVGWDLSLGSSAFWSLQYRARWLPMLGELRYRSRIPILRSLGVLPLESLVVFLQRELRNLRIPRRRSVRSTRSTTRW